MSLDCILRHHQSSLPLAVSRALVQICLPFAILAFFCAVWLILFPLLRWRWPSGKYSAAWLVRQLQVTSYSVLGYFYPSITQAALSIFSCYPIDVSVPSTTPYPSFLKVTTHSSILAFQYAYSLALVFFTGNYGSTLCIEVLLVVCCSLHNDHKGRSLRVQEAYALCICTLD